MKKRIVTCLLLLPFVFSACNQEKNNDPIPAKGEVEIWSTYATEKVFQDRTDLYDGVRMPARVSVEACKGEYEGAQVIMTATKDVSAYDAELTADLVNANGDVFKKENVNLYHQKYIEIIEAYYNPTEPEVGMTPDALLPLETAVAFGENTIKAGNNQGIYLTFDVPVDQAAGVYSGNLKVTYDGQESLVPVSLVVYDLAISQETRSMSYFNLGFSGYLGELDGTQNSWRKHVETMIEYRLAPGSVMMTTSPTEECLNDTIEEIADLVLNYGLSTISIPGTWRTGSNLTTFVVALAEKSIECNYNFLERTVVKGTDEPKVSTMDKIKAETEAFHASINNAVGKIGDLKGATPEFLEELKAGAKGIPHIITLNYQRNEQTNAANIDTYCPFFSCWHTESDRALYEDQTKGRWWYGCSGPMPPYPTYHTDDTLVSARSVGWMMAEYDIIGNLYWSMTVYAGYDGVKYSPLEDSYGKPDRYPQSNGDGYLFYPGAPYGLDTPLPTMRLEAIRDGNEEYELLYDLKKAYEDAGHSFADIQRNVSDLFYSGAIVKFENNSVRFAEARRAMIELALMAKDGVFVTEIENDQKGNITYTVVADKDYTVKESGTAVTGVVNGETATYNIVKTLNKAENVLSLSVETENNVYSLRLGLGGKVEYFKAEDLYQDKLFTKGNATATFELTEKGISLSVGEVKKGYQTVRSNFFNNFDSSVQKIVLEIENPTDEEMYFGIKTRYEGAALNTDWYTGTLQPGTNLLEIEFTDKPINGKVSYSDFYFSKESGAYEATNINIQALTIYHK